MIQRVAELTKAAASATAGFFAAIGRQIAGWVTGEDLSVFVVLALVAIVLLVVFVPNRNRF